MEAPRPPVPGSVIVHYEIKSLCPAILLPADSPDPQGVAVLVYQALKSEFMAHVEQGAIVDRIQAEYERRVRRAPKSEVRSWQNSMQFMYMALNTPDIPDGCGVAIEYGVPSTQKRIDFLLTGRNDSAASAVIIELKQWDQVEAVTSKDSIVRTPFRGRLTETTHPSYQAWSYARVLEDYNEAVRESQIGLEPCAYLHNYVRLKESDPLFDPLYAECLEAAPAFCREDLIQLREFICRHVNHADDGQVLYTIESGRLRPSKSLQDALVGMLEGNDEFVMIDDQKVVFEQALDLARRARETGEKRVLIVCGGPGTGKSVVAINLLVRLTAADMVCQYVSKNSAPRNVYSRHLRARNRTKAFIDNLFQGSGRFHGIATDAFDALIVDEAHRLNEKSGYYGNEGENQIAELIGAARFSVFFIDESQRVTLDDIGSVEDIRLHAERAGATVSETELCSQFRCNGSDSYLDWLDDALGIRELEGDPPISLDYDFRVFDDPNELFAAIRERNTERNKARLVAGYCWDWPTKTRDDTAAHDIVLPEWGFSKSWNLGSTLTWAIDDESIEEVGCIHTAQGLEFDFVGVIVGDDLRYTDGGVITDHERRAKMDKSLNGIKKMAQEDPVRAQRLADELIRNTYRVLMTRGLRGCYVFCTDRALAGHLRGLLPREEYAVRAQEPPMAAEDTLEE